MNLEEEKGITKEIRRGRGGREKEKEKKREDQISKRDDTQTGYGSASAVNC